MLQDSCLSLLLAARWLLFSFHLILFLFFEPVFQIIGLHRNSIATSLAVSGVVSTSEEGFSVSVAAPLDDQVSIGALVTLLYGHFFTHEIIG